MDKQKKIEALRELRNMLVDWESKWKCNTGAESNYHDNDVVSVDFPAGHGDVSSEISSHSGAQSLWEHVDNMINTIKGGE